MSCPSRPVSAISETSARRAGRVSSWAPRDGLDETTFGLGYTLLDATFESEETVNGESNSSNDVAEDGEPGLEGAIEITPGDRMPLVPKHQFKAFADIDVTSRLALDVNLIAMSGAYARGNENNAHEPDDEYYLGVGSTDGYAIVNLGARYQLTRWLQVIGQINNLFDTEYSTAAQLGPAGFTSSGAVRRPPVPADRWRVPRCATPPSSRPARRSGPGRGHGYGSEPRIARTTRIRMARTAHHFTGSRIVAATGK